MNKQLILGILMASGSVFAAAPVELVSVQKQDLKITTTQPLSVEAFHIADIGARISGYVSDVLVDIGDRVKAGQPLVRISVPEMEAQLAVLAAEKNQSAANVQSAQAQLKAIHSEYSRVQKLVERGSLTEKTAEETRNGVEQADAGLLSAQAAQAVVESKLKEQQALLNYATITAPFDGIVSTRSVDPGDLVSTSDTTPLLRIAQVGTLRAITYIPEREAVWLNNGDPVALSFDAYPGQSFDATISRTAGILDSKTRSMRAEIDLDNSKGLLFPGLYGQAVIELQNRRGALVVPAGTVRLNDGPAHVYAVENGTVKRIPVTLGADTGTQIEITSGLTGGEQIVANGIGRLRDGDAVSVKNRN
jgi:HlyD family secretion protein